MLRVSMRPRSAADEVALDDVRSSLAAVVSGNLTALASPGVATLTAHGLFTGQMVYLTTTGALPTGLSANAGYYVIKVDANTFRLATSLANAIAGTAINTSGTQSGTHTVRRTFGVGDGSTTFNVPDVQGKVIVGRDTGQTEFDALGETGGEKTHALTAAENGAHSHTQTIVKTNASVALTSTTMASGWNAANSGTGTSDAANMQNSGSGTGHNNLQPYIVLNAVIKT